MSRCRILLSHLRPSIANDVYLRLHSCFPNFSVAKSIEEKIQRCWMRRLSSLIILKTIKEAGNFMEITWWGIREEPHKTTCHFGDSSLRTWSKHFTLKKQKVFQFFSDTSTWFSRSNRYPCGCAVMNRHFPHHVWLVKIVSIVHYVIWETWWPLVIGDRWPVRIRIDNVVHCSFFCMLQLLSRSNRCFCGCAVMNSRFPRHLWFVKNVSIVHDVFWENWRSLAMAIENLSGFAKIMLCTVHCSFVWMFQLVFPGATVVLMGVQAWTACSTITYDLWSMSA